MMIAVTCRRATIGMSRQFIATTFGKLVKQQHDSNTDSKLCCFGQLSTETGKLYIGKTQEPHFVCTHALSTFGVLSGLAAICNIVNITFLVMLFTSNEHCFRCGRMCEHLCSIYSCYLRYAHKLVYAVLYTSMVKLYYKSLRIILLFISAAFGKCMFRVLLYGLFWLRAEVTL